MDIKNYSLAVLFGIRYLAVPEVVLDRNQVPQVPDRTVHDESFSRFYPRYGVGSVRRSSNQYRHGDRKNRNRITSKAQRNANLAAILRTEKSRRARA